MKKQPNSIKCLIIVLAFGCFFAFAQETSKKDAEEENKPQPIQITKDLSVTPLGLDTWMWTALKDPAGKPPVINGLLTVTDSMVICVNVPWRPQQVDEIARFCLEKIQRRLGKTIITGYFPRRAEALKQFKQHGVVLEGTIANRTLAQRGKITGPDQIFTKRKNLEIDGRFFHLYSTGPILGQDHVYVYIPHDKVLFLGPLVKAPRAKLPKLPQKKLDTWEKALRASQLRYPDTEFIIASRGPIRDQRAIAQTYLLIRKAAQKVN